MSFSWDKEEISVRVSRLLDTIVTLANEDEVISPDEEAIIEVVRQKLWGLTDEFENMVDQSFSIEQARTQTKLLLEDVINVVTETAKADNKITGDELVLIDKITKYIRQSNFTDLIT